MSATDLISDRQGIAIRDVKNRAILDICPFADSNLVDIASDDHLIPDARAGSDRDAADNGCIRSYVNVSRNFRSGLEKFAKPLQYGMKFHKTRLMH